MRIFRVAYNNESSFITELFTNIKGNFIVDFFNIDKRKEQKSARGIQTSLGTKMLPVIEILDENLEIIGAIWSENTSNWEEEINKFLYKN